MQNLIYPFFDNNKNAIACSCSNEYVPYLSVYLKSLFENISNENCYDIVILESDITELNKEKILEINKKSNCSIRFFNVSNLFENLNLHIQYDYFAKQCYYRLAVGNIFQNFEKVLFTDIDLIFNFDVNEIFSIDMKDFPLAACKEVLWTQENRKGKIQSGIDVEDYIKNKLKTDNYYNTGVLLVNIKEFCKFTNFESLVNIALENQFINQEQDVLNMVFSNKFKTLDYSYNYEVISVNWGGIDPNYEEYTSKIENAKIYHFLTRIKVWFHPELLKGYLWWQFARQTVFYEELLARMVEFKAKNKNINVELKNLRGELTSIYFPNINYNDKLSYVMQRIPYFEIKKFIYKLKKAVSFGERHKYYQEKYNRTKKLIKDAKALKKQYKIV